jgi:predicted nucleic acid-binding protein
MNYMNAVDTNVLLYVHDPSDPVKQAKAAALVASLSPAVLFWQVACEYIAASRKLAPHGFRQDDAWLQLKRIVTNWPLVRPSWDHLLRTESLINSHSLSFWDGLIIAAALEVGVTTLYSEDFGSVGPIHGLAIVNPFK